jgi:hypothetical protein
MDRSPEVEQLAIALLAGMKAGDAIAVASLFVENEATTVILSPNGPWFYGPFGLIAWAAPIVMVSTGSAGPSWERNGA